MMSESSDMTTGSGLMSGLCVSLVSDGAGCSMLDTRSGVESGVYDIESDMFDTGSGTCNSKFDTGSGDSGWGDGGHGE